MSTPSTTPSRTPDTLLILLGLALFLALLVPFIPAGQFAAGQPGVAGELAAGHQPG